jgi:hypothetical protein
MRNESILARSKTKNYRSLHFLDSDNYPVSGLKRALSTLIIHGINDDVVPIVVSRNYVAKHSQVQLLALDSDRGLNDVREKNWQERKKF